MGDSNWKDKGVIGLGCLAALAFMVTGIYDLRGDGWYRT